MCRNIKTLANFQPPATDDEIEVTAAAHRLIHGLQTTAAPRDRDEERRKAHERAIKRFGAPPERASLRTP